MDFSNYVRALLQQGRVVEARQLWDSVVEVIHNGTNPKLDVLGIPGVTGVAAGPRGCCGSKPAVLARTGEAPADVWARYHGSSQCFELLGLQGALHVTRSSQATFAMWWSVSPCAVTASRCRSFFEVWRGGSAHPICGGNHAGGCWGVVDRRSGMPACAFSGFRFPMIEDLINQHPSTVMFNGEKPKGLNGKGHWIGMAKERTQWALWGLPALGHYSLPTEQSPVLDDDLQFAVSLHATQKRLLASWRGRAFGTLPKLKQRWAPSLRSCLDSRLMQSPGVTAKRDLGFTGLLIILLQWGDTWSTIRADDWIACSRYSSVLQHFPCSTVWRHHPAGHPQRHRCAQPVNDCQAPTGIARWISAIPELGWCWQGFRNLPHGMGRPTSDDEGSAFRLIPRCVIVQRSGKEADHWRCCRGRTIRTVLRRQCQQTRPVQCAATGAARDCSGRLHDPELLGCSSRHGQFWQRRRGLARCIPPQPHLQGGELLLCGRLVAPWMATTCFPALQLIVVWPAIGRHKLQQVLTIGRGTGASFSGSWHVWCPCISMMPM